MIIILNKYKKFLIGFCVALSVLAGLFVGGYLMFIGGIIGIVEQFRSETISHLAVALNVLKVIMAGPTIAIISFVGIFLSISIAD